jgi:hypothetical protein
VKKIRYIDWTIKYGLWTQLRLKFYTRQLRHYENLHHKFRFLERSRYEHKFGGYFAESEINFNIELLTPPSEINKLTKLLRRRKSLRFIGLT